MGYRRDVFKVNKIYEKNLPESIMCPITLHVMCDPVVAADGFSYDRDAITECLRKSRRSPLTGKILTHTHLVPNHTLRNTIIELISAQGEGST